MPAALAYVASPAIWLSVTVAAVLAVGGGLYSWRAWQKSRPTPEQRERLRRSALVVNGKMGDANLVEIREEHLFYCYDVRGVQYTASQDISELREYLPVDLSVAIGPVYVKYDPKNPANSVVLSERWSGFQVPYSQR
jgi:hypothetical protein